MTGAQLFNDIDSAHVDNKTLVECDDGQGHWYSQLSPNQVRTQQGILPPLRKEPEPQLITTLQRKKKCRGNRREQHFRRRVRQKNLGEAAETLLMQARIERNAQTTHQSALKANSLDDGAVNVADELIQVSNDFFRHKNTSYINQYSIFLRNVLSIAS